MRDEAQRQGTTATWLSRRRIRNERGTTGRGYGAIAAGFVLVLVGFVVVLYAVWTSGTIPLNNYTYFGVGLAGVGVAAGAVGFDRGVTVKG